MPKLVVHSPSGQRVIAIDRPMTIGRQAGNIVQIAEEKASRKHARISPSGQGCLLEDLNSANGTFVNDARVARRMLRHGDRIVIGRTTIVFQDDSVDTLEGDLIAGQYRLQRKIGQGGMGAVYQAIQVSMDRTVAIKLLKPELTRSREFVESFIREARTAGQLNHPNIVHVHDFGEANGTYYISMEYVEGQDVQQLLDRHRKLPVQKALHIAGRVAEALDHAHQNGVIHRDIKPQNVMLDRTGQVKLADLGLAKAISGDGSRRSNVIMGTPHYMAPEVGKREKVDGRSDIYSLGATLYHMITGRVPFDGPNSLSVITKHINQQLPSPKQYDVTLPDKACDLITEMMAKDPAARPQTAGELVRQIDSVAQKEARILQEAAKQQNAAAEVKRRPPVRRPARRVANHRGIGAGMSFVIVLLLALIVFLVWIVFFGEPAEPNPQARRTTPRGTTQDPGERIDALLLDAKRLEDADDLKGALLKIAEAEGLSKGTWHEDRVLTRSKRVREKYERAAAERWWALEQYHEDQAASDQNLATWIRKFIRKYPNTPQVAQAKALLGSLSPAGAPVGATPNGPGLAPARADASAEAWGPVSLKAARLKGQGRYVSVKKILEQFARKYPGTPEAQRAREDLDALRTLAEDALSRLLDEGRDLSGQEHYGRAANVLLKVISADGDGRFGIEARREMDKNNARTKTTFDAADGRARKHFQAYEFHRALTEIQRCLRKLVGTQWERPLSQQKEALRLIQELFERVGRRSEAARGKDRAQVRIDDPENPNRGRKVTAYVVRVEGPDLYLSRQKAEFSRPLFRFRDDQVGNVLATYAKTPADRLGIGAYFLHKNNARAARAQLQSVVSDPAVSEVAARMLARVDDGLKLVRYDWTSWKHQLEWEMEGDWNVTDGQLVLPLDADTEASARHKKGSYRVDSGFHLSFQVTFRKGSGIFSAELLADGGADGVGVTFSSDGLRVRGTAGGQTVNTGDPALKPEPNKTYHVVLSVQDEKMRCVVNGKPLAATGFPGSDAIVGSVAFHVLGLAIALDNIVIRQGK